MSASPGFPQRLLSPHPVSPPAPVREIGISSHRDGDLLVVRYRLLGDLDSIRLPGARVPARTDGLWRHTCFEAFVGRASSGEYLEYNYSPSGDWAAYRFSAYRAGMQPLELAAPPDVVVRAGPDAFELIATMDIRGLAPPGGSALRIGVTAVIEDRAGLLSYWALKHPTGKPDFHHADGFVIDL